MTRHTGDGNTVGGLLVGGGGCLGGTTCGGDGGVVEVGGREGSGALPPPGLRGRLGLCLPFGLPSTPFLCLLLGTLFDGLK